jgi:hypothetical protein
MTWEFSTMKHEWRKREKEIYLPKNKPEIITIPAFKYFSISGEGNPNSKHFGECIETLYSLSYAIRMSYKQGFQPRNFYEYTVYPLEGVWDISDEAKKNFNGVIDKDTLVFNLMMRQPNFVTNEFAQETFTRTIKKKKDTLIKKVKFSEFEEGKCVQMMHLGSYDSESESFRIMEDFCSNKSIHRKTKQHREIYISDPRKVAPEKLKTVLRFEVE